MQKNIALTMLLTYAEALVCLAGLLVMRQRRQLGQFKFLGCFLSVRLLSLVICVPLIRLAGKQISVHTFYELYFPIYWASYAIEAALGLCVVYEVYQLAMAPLRGLRALGMLMFRWAAGVSVAVAIGMACGPHVSSKSFIVKAVTQLQQTQSILTLCMLLFVCFAIRPMGLSYRSKIFGVSFGLGLLANFELVASAWISHAPRLASTLNASNSLVFCATVGIWMTYFALPEPKRRMIVLPTTSPFLRWNQISLALGDNPGFVVVGAEHPEIFAPAEVEIMRRASLKMQPVQVFS